MPPVGTTLRRQKSFWRRTMSREWTTKTVDRKRDIGKASRRLERSAKRKAVPVWSVPTEVLILSLSPGYYSVRDQERRGIGCTEIHPANFRLRWQRLCGVQVHVRRGENGTGLTPTIANVSAGHVLDKHNGKVGFAALRLIHLFCSWWRNVFGALLEEGFEETKPDWLDWMHGHVKGRRREDCELVQRATGARLRAAGVAHINDLEDMSNAFACTASEERFWVNDEIVREKDTSFFNMRATNSMVRMTTSEGTIEALPSCGRFMGSAEAPKLFAKAYERPITEWFEGTKQLSTELKAVGLDGKERDISLGQSHKLCSHDLLLRTSEDFTPSQEFEPRFSDGDGRSAQTRRSSRFDNTGSSHTSLSNLCTALKTFDQWQRRSCTLRCGVWKSTISSGSILEQDGSPGERVRRTPHRTRTHGHVSR